jgi:hypothetical protein
MPTLEEKIQAMKPDDVCALIQRKIREKWDDRVENESSVFASRGVYAIKIKPDAETTIERRVTKRKVAAFLKELRKL